MLAVGQFSRDEEGFLPALALRYTRKRLAPSLWLLVGWCGVGVGKQGSLNAATTLSADSAAPIDQEV